MALQPGATLGPYEIASLIGAGGMGEVYKARDTRLNRTVAIKVLPPELTTDPVARQRFDREAHAVAALSHPHICPLFDIGQQDGTAFLVMEFLQGETLAARLGRGKLPLDTALHYGIQITDALAAAHKAGITHRDLKPANVMVTKAGARLVDFGLAKPRTAAIAGMTELATQQPLTGAGTILGTLQYMSPEQLEGRDADARTDIFAFGAVLYEMLTARLAFEGNSHATLIANIMHAEPAPLASVEPLMPPALDRAMRKCLAKDPDGRWQSAADLRDALRWILDDEPGRFAGTGAHTWRRWRLSFAAVVVLVALLGAAVGAVLAGRWRPTATTGAAPAMQLLLGVRPAEAVGRPSGWTPAGSRTAFTWTRDGRALVVVGHAGDAERLYVRPLDSDQARPLAGTDGARGSPVVSADGKWVAFWAAETIRKVPLSGGPVEILGTELAVPSGLAWAADGQIFYSLHDGPIRQLSAGGAPSAVTRLSATELGHFLPRLLPGDRALVYTVRRRRWTWGDEEVVAYVRATGATRVLVHDAADARYVPSGHLLFLRRGQLFAVPFDPVRLEVRGTPVAVLDGVAQALSSGNSGEVTGAGQFAVAPTGTLAWVSGAPVPYPDGALAAVSRRGHLTTLPAPARSYGPVLRVAPDGQRIAVTVRSLTRFSLCMYDMLRGTLTTLTNDGEVDWPTWTPDGGRLAFMALVAGRNSLNWFKPDGSQSPEVLAYTSDIPSSWLPTGRGLAMLRLGQIHLGVIGEGAKATFGPPITAAVPASSAEFSPNGHWLAYQAYDSGRFEVYLQPFPEAGPRVQVSTQGGMNPAWNSNGNELFFLAPASGPQGDRTRMRMMVVAVHQAPALHLGTPQQLFEFSDWKDLLASGPTRAYDVAPDGQRFFTVQHAQLPEAPAVTHINVIVNWLDALNEKVPSGVAR